MSEHAVKPVEPERGGERAGQGEAPATQADAPSPAQAADPRAAERLNRADASTRERMLIAMQQQHGNAYVQRAVGQRQVQRQQDAGAPAGAPPPAPDQSVQPDLPKFPFISVASPGDRFDSEYIAVGPTPKVGTLNITLKVSIDFKDFDSSMIRSPAFKAWFEKHPLTSEQRKDFKWSEKEKDEKRKEFGADFKNQVERAWSGKHQFLLKEPGFSEYQCNVKVNVQVVDDPAKAHNAIKLQKVPTGVEARFRSFVSGKSSTLDARAAHEDNKPISDPGYGRGFVTQIEPFGFDSDVLTPDLAAQVSAAAGRMRPLQNPTQTDSLLGEDWAVDITGRASAKGEKSYNEKLGMRRAQAVEGHLKSELGRPGARPRALSKGEEHASEDPQFQRVDLQVWNVPKAFEEPQPQITQNTAAHEAGHMFGLDDEYEEEVPDKDVKAKFKGDKPEEYDKVKELMGEEAADELRMADSSNIMSKGMEVKRGHYVFFLEAINQLTSKRWTVGA